MGPIVPLRGQADHLVECLVAATGQSVWLPAAKAIQCRDARRVVIVMTRARPAFVPRVMQRDI